MHINIKDKSAVNRAAEILAVPGAVLLVPTDTVYGLICRWGDITALARIRSMKGRNADKPFQMLAPDLASAERTGVKITDAIRKVATAFTPGPLTIIADAEGEDYSSIGFRIPDYPFILNLLAETGGVFAATSANYAGAPPAESVEDALSVLADIPDAAVDGGRIKGDASTVVDMRGDSFKILRNGPVTELEISAL